MTIRLRLTLFYASLLAVALTLFSVLVFTTLRYLLVEQVDRDLLQREIKTRDAVLAVLDEGNLASVTTMELELLHDRESLFTTPGIFVQLLDPQGQSLIRSPNLGPTPANAAVLSHVISTTRSWHTITLNTQRIRLLNAPLMVDGQLVGMLQVGQSLALIDRALDRLWSLLITGTALTTLLVGGLGLRIASRALEPISLISRRAHAIVERHDLNTRLPVANPSDELGQLATAFNEALDQIALLFQAQRRFVADAAHELRTPLTSIRGFTALLRRGAAQNPADMEEALTTIDREAARLTRLVNDLLILARSETGEQELTRHPVALTEVAADVLRQMQRIAPTHTLTLQRIADPVVSGDPDQLRQLCLNLLDNARRHTPAGSTITLTLATEGHEAILQVADNGPGIPPETLPFVFEPFFRGHRGRSGPGTGLGLAIAARVAANHEGTLTATNGPAGGAIFTLRLPLVVFELDDE